MPTNEALKVAALANRDVILGHPDCDEETREFINALVMQEMNSHVLRKMYDHEAGEYRKSVCHAVGGRLWQRVNEAA